MRVDRIREFDRDLDEGEADEQAEYRKQEFEVAHWAIPPPHAGRTRPKSKVKKKVEADDPARNRCGCFLPDLTRLATAPSADFRAGIWVKRMARASSCWRTHHLHQPFTRRAQVQRKHAGACPHAPTRRVPFDPCRGGCAGPGGR